MQDQMVEQTSAGAMYGGAVATFTVYGLNLPELAAIITAVVALVGAAVNVWYVYHKNRRAEEAHKAEMERMRNGNQVKDEDAE